MDIQRSGLAPIVAALSLFCACSGDEPAAASNSGDNAGANPTESAGTGGSGTGGSNSDGGESSSSSDGGTENTIEIADYYVSPSGSDSNPGTIDEPFKTFARANSAAAPGNLIYLRAGVYAEPVELSTSGTSAAPIRWQGYPGETAIIEGPGRIVTNRDGALIVSASSLSIRDLTVRKGARAGIIISGRDVHLSRIVSHGNGRVGIYFFTAKGGSLTDSVTFDNYDKYDSDGTLSHGQDADGFAASWSSGVVVKRVLSFNNADDGFDLWESSDCSIEESFAFGNGINRWGDSAFVGNGNGFKLGGPSSKNNLAHRNVAFDNVMRGFDDNGAVNSRFYNNTSIKNTVGFNSASTTNTWINNVGLDNVDDRWNEWSGVSDNNSWDLGLSVKAAHFASVVRPAPNGFESLDAMLALFYKSDFALPAVGGPLVDAGKKVTGVTYEGASPDLGARER